MNNPIFYKLLNEIANNFSGKEFTKEKLFEYMIKDDNESNCLKPTTESQGHGTPFEYEVLPIIGFNLDTLKTYKSNEKYDGKKEDSPDNRNKSIKTTGKNAPDCGDIIRFLTSEELDIIIICYLQKGNYKVVEKTISIKFESILKIIKLDIQKLEIFNSNNENEEYIFNNWITEIKKFIKCIKDAPKKTGIKDLSYNKQNLELSYFGIRPKTSQDRVQCELKLKKILPLLKQNIDYTTEEGAFINGKPYISKILSPPRNRKGQTKKVLMQICRDNKLKGFSKYNKEDLINFIKNNGHSNLLIDNN